MVITAATPGPNDVQYPKPDVPWPTGPCQQIISDEEVAALHQPWPLAWRAGGLDRPIVEVAAVAEAAGVWR